MTGTVLLSPPPPSFLLFFRRRAALFMQMAGAPAIWYSASVARAEAIRNRKWVTRPTQRGASMNGGIMTSTLIKRYEYT